MSDIAIKASEPLTLRAQLTEDWLAVVIGILVFGPQLVRISGVMISWDGPSTPSVYKPPHALPAFAKTYAWLGGGGALISTSFALLVVLGARRLALGVDVRKFALAFTATFAIAYASWILGSYAYIAAVTPAEQQKFGIAWSLKLSPSRRLHRRASCRAFVIANFFPRFAGKGSDPA